MTKNKKIIANLILFLILLSINYSTSYQQFRHFNVDQHRGMSDQKSYIMMSKGEYDVSRTHKYRFLIPKTVYYLRPIVELISPPQDIESQEVQTTKISFFIINCLISSLTAFILFYYLISLGLDLLPSFLGSIVFITSRTTIINTGVPMVDSAQNLAIIVFAFSVLKNKVNILSYLSPVLILTKETLFPIFFLPLLKKNFRNLKYIFALSISIFLFFFVRGIINSISLSNQIIEADTNNIAIIFFYYFKRNFQNLGQIFSIKFLYNFIFTSYSLFLVIGIYGFYQNKIKRILNIPNSIKFLAPYSVGLGFVSGDIGRMFFMSFPVIIPYISLGADLLLKKYFHKINNI